MTIVGISLGNTNSMITAYKGDRLIKIPNTLGEYLTPSVVSFDEEGNIYVGEIARERKATCPNLTLFHFKEFIGSDKYLFVNNKQYRGEELASFIIKELINYARNYLGEEITGAIIAVPTFFNNFQRQAIKLAGELAGVKVHRLINDPVAATLGYSCRNKEEKNLMIFDLGGGILEISLVATYGDTIEVLSSDRDEHLGGDNFTESIAEYFCSVNAIDRSTLTSKEEEMLLRKCEEIKILSDHKYGEITIRLRKKSYTLNINEKLLMKAYAEYFSRIEKTVVRSVKAAKIPLESIKDIIMVGGGSKAPIIKSFLTQLTGITPITPLNPEEIVAIGAGTIAGIAEGNPNLRDIVIKDICPFSIGINAYNEGNPENDIFTSIIDRNTTLPCSKVRSFTTTMDNQKTIDFKIYQGENIYCRENLEIGSIKIDLPQVSKGTKALDVCFTYNTSGLVEVEVINLLTHQVTKEYLVSRENTMTEEEIKKSLEELEKIKIHPREEIKNKHLIEWAKRLYQENTGEARELIFNTLEYFERALNLHEELIIKKAYDYCYRVLSMMDKTKDFFSIGDCSEEHPNQENGES
ncbi:MAG: Hsp70 family protein, partial [Clostridiaceae bacterium]